MASSEMEKGWESVQKSIDKSDFTTALTELRLLDEDGSHAMTWKLAGDCKRGMTEELGAKKASREAIKHYRKALKMDPKFKDARVNLEGLQNEMLAGGVKERAIPRIIDDGTPTLFGIIVLPLMLMVSLAGVKVIADGTLTEDAPAFDYTAIIHVEWTDDDGTQRNEQITLELYPDKAPIHVENWLGHARDGNYDGIRFHRVIDGFMIQGGDIEGMDGSGGYAHTFQGYCNGQESTSCDQSQWTIPDEADNGLLHEPGSLAMAKTSAPHTGGSQFYIVDYGSKPNHLDGVHTVFGKVTQGMEVVKEMGEVETDGRDKPINEMTVTSIDVDQTENKGLLDYLMFWE